MRYLGKPDTDTDVQRHSIQVSNTDVRHQIQIKIPDIDARYRFSHDDRYPEMIGFQLCRDGNHSRLSATIIQKCQIRRDAGYAERPDLSRCRISKDGQYPKMIGRQMFDMNESSELPNNRTCKIQTFGDARYSWIADTDTDIRRCQRFRHIGCRCLKIPDSDIQRRQIIQR